MNPKKPAAPAEQAAPAGADKQPRIVTAIGIIPTKGGWTSLKYTIQGDRVLAVEHSEPDLKLIAKEKFLQNAGRLATSEEGKI